MGPYMITTYQVGDVIRRYPVTKIGGGNPNKYGNWWRGLYLLTAFSKIPIIYGYEKVWYSIQNLITAKEYYADVTYIKPFYYDFNYVIPLNVAVKVSLEIWWRKS
jgi:hypothetical protein